MTTIEGAVAGPDHAPVSAGPRGRAPLWGVAATVVLVHLAMGARYGFHRDELYLLAAGRHLDWGYVDSPPLVPLLARAVGALTGERLVAFRAVAGAVHGLSVVVTGLIARELGGGRRATVLAGLATATAPLFVATGSVFHPVVFDHLWWAVVVLVVARLVNGASPRWWPALGLALGAGLQTRWTIAVLAAGLLAGVAATGPARRRVSRWGVGVAGAVAAAVWLPFLVWNGRHGWPAVDLALGHSTIGAGDGRIVSLVQQVVLAGPVGLVLALAGVAWLLREPRWRPLGLALAVVAAVAVASGTKSYALGSAYVPAFAAGGVAAADRLGRSPGRDRRVVGALVATAAAALVVATPLLPVGGYAHVHGKLNDEPGEEVGWPEAVRQVADVVAGLPPGERDAARVVTMHYGEAAAIDHYGPALGLPRGTALSAHNSYATWWRLDRRPPATVVVGFSRWRLEHYCDEVEGPVAELSNRAGVANDAAGAPVWVCRGLRIGPDELRDALRRLD